MSRQWDSCPLGLGLVVEDKLTEFLCIYCASKYTFLPTETIWGAVCAKIKIQVVLTFTVVIYDLTETY